MKKKITIVIMILILALSFSGCNKKKENVSKNTFNIYYVNALETKVVPFPEELTATDRDGKIEEALKLLQSNPDDSNYKRTIPKGVKIVRWTLDKEKQLKIVFSSQYNDLQGINELLCRAAVVKTLSQFTKDVEYVEFYVDEQPLMIGERQVGIMKGSNFIDNSRDNFNYEEEQKLTLYFTDVTGKKLKSTYVTVKYDGTTQLERLVINQLIAGPESIENRSMDIYATIPKGTILNTISTSNGVCYVDLNKSFLNKLKGNSDEVTVYSVINSLVELPTVNKVQITINGDTVKTYNSITDFDKLHDMNYQIIEK
ncbi:spore germination protein [Lachnospiraceae bacterium KM106-2]|nr:spore germination protein [Lachnospiraceae bacterium KM106-2]